MCIIYIYILYSTWYTYFRTKYPNKIFCSQYADKLSIYWQQAPPTKSRSTLHLLFQSCGTNFGWSNWWTQEMNISSSHQPFMPCIFFGMTIRRPRRCQMWSSNPPQQSTAVDSKEPLLVASSYNRRGIQWRPVTSGHLVLGLSLSLSMRSLDALIKADQCSCCSLRIPKGHWISLIQHS